MATLLVVSEQMLAVRVKRCEKLKVRFVSLPYSVSLCSVGGCSSVPESSVVRLNVKGCCASQLWEWISRGEGDHCISLCSLQEQTLAKQINIKKKHAVIKVVLHKNTDGENDILSCLRFSL